MELEGEGGGHERRAVAQEVMALVCWLGGWLAAGHATLCCLLRNLVLLAGSASAVSGQNGIRAAASAGGQNGQEASGQAVLRPLRQSHRRSAIANPVSIRRCPQ